MEDRTRMWGASKELSAIMRRPVKDSDVTWDTVELLIPGAQFTVWSRDDGISSPDFNNEPDLKDLCSEEYVTRQFSKNLYWGIEQWRKEAKSL